MDENWYNQHHNIYEYDLKSSQVKKITESNYFDFMPISISKDEILFCRSKNDRYHSLIKLTNGKEEILADSIIINYFATEKDIDIFVRRDNGDYSSKEKIKSQNTMNELYKFKGTKICDNSKVGNMINLLDFPEELVQNGIELFTKEEPYGLQVNFKSHKDIQMKYMAMSSDNAWRNQSII